MSNPNEKFWMDDLTELYKNNNYLKIFPKYEMTREEQLNAITRFCLIFIVLILIFDTNEDWLYLPITIIVLLVIIYNVNISAKDKKSENMMPTLPSQDQSKQSDQESNDQNTVESIKSHNNKSAGIQSGYYDKKGLLYESTRSHPVTLDQFINREANTCRVPPLVINEINDINVPVPANADDEEINNENKVIFNHNLFRDVNEVFERENNSRTFYSPINDPNPDSVLFAKNLYSIPDSSICKVDQGACLRYEDLRYKQNPG